ncbi:MAG: hypothetical protein AAF612_12405 [Planctomycetota bacterium]
MPEAPETVCVALVGHCGFDGSMLRKAVTQAAQRAGVQARLVDVGDQAGLERGAPQLALVNRKLLGRFDASEGGPLIERWLAGQSGSCRQAMLISNLPDAQASAEAVGALPGVGKSDLRSDAAIGRLAEALRACLGSSANADEAP